MNYLVVANGEPPTKKLLSSLWSQHESHIAVDGGLYSCLNSGFIPELLIGDFDSLDAYTLKKYAHIPQIHTPDQNLSDLEKALLYLFDRQATNITVCGALGRRLDHTLTNICLLSRFPVKVKFETETEVCFALPNQIQLSTFCGQTLSLIPLNATVKQVTTDGLKWELKGQDLDKNALSLSNIATKNTLWIQFLEGDLLVCLNKETESDILPPKDW